MPSKIENTVMLTKLATTLTGVVSVKVSLELVYTCTVLYKIIATASFIIPSPKIIDASLGCSSVLIKLIAAMISDEQIRADC